MTATAELGCSRGPALVIGATGYIGRFVAEACLESGCATYILVRPGSACPARAATVDALRAKGAIVLEGSANDNDFMERKLREEAIEVVISAMGGPQILDQLNLLEAIKAVGSIKRFLPSEFGHDIEKANPVEPGLSFYREKRKVRRAIEAAGIPYTYICCNSIAGWPYHNNTHPSEITPPLDRFQIYGDGNVKAFFVAGCDIGKFTIKAAYDSRTLNKTVHFRPACNLLSLNEMASMWESKIGRTLPRVSLTEKDLLAVAKENCIPASIVAALTHDIFINGCQINFSIDGCKDVEITCLYPDISFRTIDECFNDYAAELKQGNKITSPTSMVYMASFPPTHA
ncbi:leucoanthocyanidin reductase-like [Phoenix dactylifera]|uniref:Leucoanthocyanidin reductase-like n=1 Tax=Phoenix dactylifera TaxID=42345 RepID=A0A8B7BLI2_PHODC|nr:leucoanthocyanidin reductase-like [Phoenix dactylifera]